MKTIRRQPNRLYLVVIVAWLVFTSIILAVVINSNIDLAKSNFISQTTTIFGFIDNLVKINETIVESFSATVSAVDVHDHERIRKYAKLMMNRYPHIFMFEITEKVLKKDKTSFEQHFQKHIYQDFKIRSFTYETNRQWQGVVEKDFYMPITFMEPFPPSSRKVLGLDVSSNPFLIDSLQKSVEEHASVATRPFTLVEGDLAYLIYKPITRYGVANSKHDHNFNLENRYAILVILAKTLFTKTTTNPEYNITLYHSDFHVNESKGILHHQAGRESSNLESIVFPKLTSLQKLENISQPFNLLIEQQLGWSILNWWLLLIVAIVAVLSFFVMLYYAKFYHQLEATRKQAADSLFYRANHDSLTGLANHNLMQDRLRHALTQAERSKTCLAVLFMDLNGFKNINDTYGHHSGDTLLQNVGERILACIRRGDTLARRSGDEFVLVLENIQDIEKANEVIKKIRVEFSKCFYIKNDKIKIDISIGMAIYPNDTTDETTLLDLADKRMYENKKQYNGSFLAI